MAKFKAWLGGIGTGALVASALWALVLIGECKAWRGLAKVEKRPVHVSQTERFKGYQTVKVPLDLEIPVVPKKDLGKLAGKYGRPDLVPKKSGDGESISGGLGNPVILGEYSIPKLPYGGNALVSASQGGVVSVDVSPNQKKFFDFDSSWRVRAGVGVDSSGQEVLGVLVGWTGPTTGRISYGFDSYLMAGRDGSNGGVLLTIGF